MPIYVYCNNPTQILKDLNRKIRSNIISTWVVHLGSYYICTVLKYQKQGYLLAKVGQGRLVFNVKFNQKDQLNKQYLYVVYTTTMAATLIEHLSLDHPELYVAIPAPTSIQNNLSKNIQDD